jgi:phosphotransferase system HPr (HPr) family protein
VENGHPTAENTPLRATVKVSNPKGLHMRAAFAFAKLAAKFRSTVTVRKQDRRVNGKSGVSLMTLAAVPDTELDLEIAGEDAQAALPILSKALAAPSADGLDRLIQ